MDNEINYEKETTGRLTILMVREQLITQEMREDKRLDEAIEQAARLKAKMNEMQARIDALNKTKKAKP